MQFTKAEEYGTLGVLYLAEKNSPGVTPLSEITSWSRGVQVKSFRIYPVSYLIAPI